MRNSKVLGIGHLPPPIHGASLMTEKIKHELQSDFEQLFWINLSNSNDIKVIGRLSLRKVVSVFRIYLVTLSSLILNRFDICYITTTSGGVGFLKDIPIIILSKFRSKRTILHLHNRGFVRYPRESFYGFVFSEVLNRCEIWLLSDRLFSDIDHLVDLKACRVLPNTIQENLVNEKVSNPQDKHINLLFMSNLIKAKGVLLLVEALRNIRGLTVKGLHLKIAGADVDLSGDELTNVIKENGLENIIEVVGPIYDKRKHELLRECDILLLPSFYDKECLPLTLIEGAYYSCALISTKAGAIEDIVVNGFNGYVVDPGDLTALQKAMLRLINDNSLLKRYKENSKAIYWERFSNKTFKRKLREIIYDPPLY